VRLIGKQGTCGRFERTCEALALAARGGARLESSEARESRSHAQTCAECAGALRVAETLHAGREAIEVPEPDPAYWTGFNERLDARLREARTPDAATPSRAPGTVRALLAAAAAVALVAAGLAVLHARRAIAPAPAEAELVERLGRAPGERVTEVLDEVAPPELSAAEDELAEAADLLHDGGAVGAPGADDDESYDLFFGSGDDDRDLWPQETHGENG